jgi:excisionase family DNA binding protein
MSTEKPSEHNFVSTREAAMQLGVSVRTVQLWAENGVLQAWKTAGGHRRIARESVETLLAEQQAVIATASGLHPLTIVLIDDNPAQLRLYQLKLESLDLPLLVTATTDGLEGLMIIGQSNPDIVILSLALANIDAVSLVASIAKRLPSTRIIALSADQEDETTRRLARFSEQTTFLSPIDDLDAIGPILNAWNAPTRVGRSETTTVPVLPDSHSTRRS